MWPERQSPSRLRAEDRGARRHRKLARLLKPRNNRRQRCHWFAFFWLMTTRLREPRCGQPCNNVPNGLWSGKRSMAVARCWTPFISICLSITVMDFIMPESNGLEASRHLFRQYPDVLILLVTTDPSKQLEKEARRVGIRGYVCKERN